MNTIKNIVIGVLVITTLVFSVIAYKKASLGAASGTSHFQKESFLQGLAAGVRDQFSLTNAGVLTTSGAATFTGAATLATLTQGGGIRATSTVNSAETLLAADFDVENDS